MQEEIINHELLRTNLTPDEAISLQLKWAADLARINSSNSQNTTQQKRRIVAGTDISFPAKNNPEWGIAAAVLWDIQEQQELAHVTVKGSLNFPYIPGLLGFRESALIVKALLQLPYPPDIVFCDGHGVLHPRAFGEAVQIGTVIRVPSIGVAKELYVGDGDWHQLKRIKGEKVPIRYNTQIQGYAICLHTRYKPVFVSGGFQMDLDTAIEIALQTTINHRQPEPLFLAHAYSKQLINRGLTQ